MKFISNLFKPKEIKICQIVLEEYILELKTKFNNNEESIWIGATLIDLKKTMNQTIKKKSDEIISTIESGKGTPRIIVLRLMFYLCKNRLTTGNNHTYRGSLSSTGKAYYKLANEILEFLKKLGELNEADIKTIKEDLKNNIEVVG